MIYLISFISGLILSTGILLIRRSFYSLSIDSVSLLDAVLHDEGDDVYKQQILIKRLLKLLGSLFIFLFLLCMVIITTWLPFYIFDSISATNIDYWTDLFFYLSITLGSLLPFLIFPLIVQKKDYSELSVLLHRIILDNYNVSKFLFGFEKKYIKNGKPIGNKDFVIVSGLARAGTTALTLLLYKSGYFHSLSYANMPFLMNPKSWEKIYNPRKSKLRARSHGDKVLFGFDSVEAFEEYFWKVILNDDYILKDRLVKHQIDMVNYDEYIIYQNLVKRSSDNDGIYLSKNNNFILRYESIREKNKQFKLILLFRDPINHSQSLLNQHLRFSEMQNEDSFVEMYMNWLGHHEFGNNHKMFALDNHLVKTDYNDRSLNYWIDIWINYYSYILTLSQDDNLILIEYNDFLDYPHEVISYLEKRIGFEIDKNDIQKFSNVSKQGRNVDEELLETANYIYNQLCNIKVRISRDPSD